MNSMDSISDMIKTNKDKLKEIQKLQLSQKIDTSEPASDSSDKYKKIGMEMNQLIKSIEDEFSDPSSAPKAKKKLGLSDDLNDILTEIDGPSPSSSQSFSPSKKSSSKSSPEKEDKDVLIKKGNDPTSEVKGMLEQLQSMMNIE